MAFFIDKNSKAPQHVELNADIYRAAEASGTDVASYINREYAASADLDHGTPFKQLLASEGLAIPEKNKFGIRPALVGDILEGKASISAATSPSNNSDRGSPFGSAARVLYPVAILDIVEDILAKDRMTDTVTFDQMIAQDISITGDNFIQPVVTYQGLGGPESAKAQRSSEFTEPGNILRIGTSEKIRSLPSFTIGVETSDKATKALSIDVVAMAIARYVEVERDQRVYSYLSALFSGDNDLISGAVPAVTSNSLDTAATGGVLTHKAWVKFLARYRKYRNLTHLVMDIDTYLKVEGRTGRPGSNNYDPTLARIDPQARAANMANIGFGNDVKFFIVDAATDGGPVPANTIWALDATKAITRISNTSANTTVSEAFVLRRSTALRMDWSEAVYRTRGDTELKPFDVLTIS